MTPTAKIALMMGVFTIGAQHYDMYESDHDKAHPPHTPNPRVGKTQLTPKQRKARNKSKNARKARRKK